jgi:hypothetical protein
MQEVDFTRPSSEDFEDWADMEHDAWFYALVEDILACYREGDTDATEASILALSEGGKHSLGDISNVFEYFATVANDESIEDPEFKEKVINLLNLFKPAE